MQILNKIPNIREDICYRVGTHSKVSDTNMENVKKFISAVEELSKEEKSVYNIDDLSDGVKRIVVNHLVRVKKQENQQRAGYALISGITLIGTIAVGAIIFMAIKFIMFG